MADLTPLGAFMWGAIGSAAIEVVTINREYRKHNKLPGYYKKWSFWLLRFIIVILSGFLVVAYKIKTIILAVQIGASTPLIIGRWGQDSEITNRKQK